MSPGLEGSAAKSAEKIAQPSERPVGEMLSVLIVDDETPARARLRVLLDDLRSEVPTTVVGEAVTGTAAVEWFSMNAADVVLLDIHMPGMNGLAVARHLLRLPEGPAVIFVTAYEAHAIEAFEVGAIDYLLKPVRPERLATALLRARRLALSDDDLLHREGGKRDRLLVTDRGRVRWLALEDILFFRSEDKYVVAQTRDHAYLITESLVKLEEEFDHRFLRIHRACLVNTAFLSGFEMTRGQSNHWEASLRDWPERLPVSRRQAHVVREFRAGKIS